MTSIIQPGLDNYALIGNCLTSAVVSKQGSIDWFCLPVFNSPSIFARLLDIEGGGCFSISCTEIVEIKRRYIQSTAVLETTIISAHGSIRLTDCMTLLPEAGHANELRPLHEILRKVEVISGSPTVVAKYMPKPDYAKPSARYQLKRCGKAGWSLVYKHCLVNLITNFPMEMNGKIVTGTEKLTTGNNFWFSLTYNDMQPGILLSLEEAQQRLEQTINWWNIWCQQCHYHGKWREQILHSAIILRLLIYSVSGALLAAATTSLPEHRNGWNNWDYRYSWPRDAAITLRAFTTCGFNSEAVAFFHGLMRVGSISNNKISNVFDLYGLPKIKEKAISWLSGYHGAKPVRVGNNTCYQLQMDIYGEIMLAIEHWSQYRGDLSNEEYLQIQRIGRMVSKKWHLPDIGIWKLKDKPRHYTHSKVMCWYVLDYLIRLHKNNKIKIPFEKYTVYCAELRQLIEEKSYDSKRESYITAFEEECVDASLLLLPRSGYVHYNDTRMLNTWKAIKSDLEHDGLIMRFPQKFADTELSYDSLIVCNFWAIDYLFKSGQKMEAEQRLKRLLHLSNDVGIYCEGVDIASLQPLGNLPHASSHASMINTLLLQQSLSGLSL